MLICTSFMLVTGLGQALPIPLPVSVSGNQNGHSFAVSIRQARFAVHGRKLVWVVAKVERSLKGYKYRYHVLGSKERGAYNIYAGFSREGRAYRFWDADGRAYDEVEKVKPVSMLSDKIEVSALSVVIDGKKLVIPPTLYWDLLSLHSYKKENLNLSVAKDGSLSMKIPGSDGGGAHSVRWRFRKSGRHDRFVSSEV